MSTWKTSWKFFKKEVKEVFALWNIVLALTTSIIANVISYYTGYSVETVIAAIFGLLLIIIITPMIIYVIINKYKNKQ